MLRVLSECRERWQIIVNVRFSGGTEHASVTSVAECMQLCLATATCLAADYNSDSDQCWIHTNVADLTQTIAATRYRQYLLLNRCENGR